MNSSGERVRRIEVRDRGDRFVCATASRSFATSAGLSARASAELAIAVAELASNIARHAVEGYVEFRALEGAREGVEVVCVDHGPGIVDPNAAREDGFSLGLRMTPETSRAEGLGLGLGAVGRMVDELYIESSPGTGTTVTVRKFMKRR